MIEIKKYNYSDKEVWNDFINKSRIDTFLFNRDFMDYHSDRFEDMSFLFYRKGKLEAVLPGNIQNETYYSHQGLTYGGLVLSKKMTTNDVLNVFKLINEELKIIGINNVIYKPLPEIYQLYPSQEDMYALFRLGAIKIGCNISSTIFQDGKIPFTESRKSGVRKAKNENVFIEESNDFFGFWNILENNLFSTHRKKPVHSLDEIILLKSKFPDKVRLFICLINGEVVGGCLLFVMNKIVHVQYISANEKGKLSGSLDLLFDELINHLFANIPIFDFGHSTEQLGNYLNENLIFQKEGFGGRGIVYEIYKYNL